MESIASTTTLSVSIILCPRFKCLRQHSQQAADPNPTIETGQALELLLLLAANLAAILPIPPLGDLRMLGVHVTPLLLGTIWHAYHLFEVDGTLDGIRTRNLHLDEQELVPHRGIEPLFLT